MTNELAHLKNLSPDEMREKIVELEAHMRAQEQIEIETTHHFAPGIYMRQILIPAGALVTGKIHKTEHLNILSQGELIVWTEDGMKRLHASTVVKSSPGIKRVGLAVTDSVWITVHPNVENEQDVEKLEAALVVDTFDQFLEHKEAKQIEEDSSCHSLPQP